VRYFIKGDVNDIIALLKSYYPTIWSTLSDRLAGLFLDLSFPLYLRVQHMMMTKRQFRMQKN